MYGGVHILGIARHINPAYMKILANQTRQAGQRVWQNKVWGDAANRYHFTLVQQRYPGPEYKVEIDRYFKNPIAARYPDVTVLSNGKPIHCSEVKTGSAPVNPRQARVDS